MSEERLERLKLLLAQDHILLGTSSSTRKKKEIRGKVYEVVNLYQMVYKLRQHANNREERQKISGKNGEFAQN